MFQSSGYGKSRLIYLCLQNKDRTGYPSRTSVGADLFENILYSLKEGEEWRFVYVLQNAIKCFQSLKCSPEDLWNNQMDELFCWKIWNRSK